MDTIAQAIGSFLAQHESNTARSYSTGLGHFARYLSRSGILAHEATTDRLTIDHAIRFVDYVREEKFKRSTVQTYLTSVYRFCRYLFKVGAMSEVGLARLEETYRDARQVRGQERPKDHRLEAVVGTIEAARGRTVQPGPDAERHRLIRLRDVAIVETLRATGCRVGELVGLCVGDLERKDKRAQVKGKGSKYRKVYWDELAWAALTGYLKARGVQAKTEPLFAGHGNRSEGQALTTRHVSRIVRELREQAGVDGVTPHYFRHVFATRALETTENLALVQDMMGHASPVTTRVYARTDDEQRKEAHKKVWA